MPMSFSERLGFFTANYKLIADGIYGFGPKQYIGSKQPPRRCRFCTAANPTFSTAAHAIPECLGNHQLILHEECDSCNTYFSEVLEDHFDKYTKPFRTLAQIKGKKKIPSYKSRDHATRIDVGSEVRIATHVDASAVEFDEGAPALTFHLDIEPFIPVAAYKALVKMALSTIDNDAELAGFTFTIRWIRDPDHSHAMLSPLRAMVSFVPGPRPNPGVTSMLFRRRDDAREPVPYAIYVLAFGNLIYQVIVPSHLDASSGESRTFEIPFFPSPFEQDWPYGEVKHAVEDLSSIALSPSTRTLRMHANSVAKTAV